MKGLPYFITRHFNLGTSYLRTAVMCNTNTLDARTDTCTPALQFTKSLKPETLIMYKQEDR